MTASLIYIKIFHICISCKGCILFYLHGDVNILPLDIAWHSTPGMIDARTIMANTVTSIPIALENTQPTGHANKTWKSKLLEWLPSPVNPDWNITCITSTMTRTKQNTMSIVSKYGIHLGNYEPTQEIHGASSTKQNLQKTTARNHYRLHSWFFLNSSFSPFHISQLNVRSKKAPEKYIFVHNLSYLTLPCPLMQTSQT